MKTRNQQKTNYRSATDKKQQTRQTLDNQHNKDIKTN